MIPEQDAVELVEGIERAARRTRPFMIYGLIAIMAGFGSLSYYLYEDREREAGLRRQLESRKAELETTLSHAQALARRAPSETNSANLRQVLGIAVRQVASLETIAAQIPGGARPSPSAAAPPPMPRATAQGAAPQARSPSTPAQSGSTPPGRVEITTAAKVEAPRPARLEGPSDEIRFVLRISDASQLAGASALAETIRHGIIANGRLFRVSQVTIVPPESGAEPGDNSFRCFDFYACDWAQHIAPAVNANLSRPQLEVREIGSAPSSIGTIDYQIWFAPGPIGVTGR